MDISSRWKLNSSVQIPALGLGTWQLTPVEAENAVRWALEAGYRHIDTAAIYGNEESVGKAVRASNIPREQLFIATKLWNDDHRNPEKALAASLKRLQMDYVDLYLIHWPVENLRNQAWKALEKLWREGKCRAIGVSNFTIRHLKELRASSEVVPAVNQVEFNLYLYQKELREFCRSEKIQLEAYCPLARGHKMRDPELVEMAARYGKSPAQVMIRWLLQHEIVAIPKSKSRERILENAGVFDFALSPPDMRKLDSFDEGFRVCWDPTHMP